MAIGERRTQVQAAREALKRKLGQQEGLEVREAVLPPSQIQLGSERPGGTRLIETMRSALVEVPPERLAGVVLLTDGQVHDVPAIESDKNLPPELGGAPVHALIAGKKNERDRLIVLEQSPRFGVVGREVTAKFKIEDPAGGTAPVTLSVERRGRAAASTCRSASRSSCRSPSAIPAPTSSSSRWRPARTSSPSTTTAACSPSTACATGCACCWSRASPTRASGRGGTC